MTLTADQLDELRHIAKQRGDRSGPSTPPYDGYTRDRRMARRLVRGGYLSVETFSEHIRGERRFYWPVFYLTEAGRQAVGKVPA